MFLSRRNVSAERRASIAAIVRADTARYARVVKDAGLKLD